MSCTVSLVRRRGPMLLAGLCLLSLAWALRAAPPVAEAPRPAASPTAEEFPRALVDFRAYEHNPVFTAEGPGHWDVRIRERGWILRDESGWRLWFTGYDGTREGRKLLGLATSDDGISWQRDPRNPLDRDHWIEDMTVLRHGGTYYMFAEGERDQAHWLTSPDGVTWAEQGKLKVLTTAGEPISPGPYGTPTVWVEHDTWYLFYERMDRGIWLATSRDLQTWQHVQDEPVLVPGPEAYDSAMVAFNQIVRHEGRYYAYYHASSQANPKEWCSAVAVSTDLRHWKKYPGNPILRENKSSPQLVPTPEGNRLYTLHNQVQLHFAR